MVSEVVNLATGARGSCQSAADRPAGWQTRCSEQMGARHGSPSAAWPDR
ncbi:MAG: hypothetical protein QOI54_2732 [Actinomycetota bacterium]|jgi:hypothetical protein|nr:hypothetical protein [Actinomycetota bacterium]